MEALPPMLWEMDSQSSEAAVSVAGLMAEFVGPLLSLEDLARRTDIADCAPGVANSIRAYPVPRLEGNILPAVPPVEIASRLQSMLCEMVPKWDWRIPVNCWIEKFYICHACVPAPPDTGNMDSMALEIFGEVIGVDGEDLSSSSALDRYQRSLHRPGDERFSVRISSVTYANVAWLGVDVPFYS